MSLLLFFLVAICFCLLAQSKWKLFRLGSSLAGPWALPLLGNAQMIGKLKPEFIFLVFTELRERFGCTYRLWLGPQLWVFLHTAEETREALNDTSLRKADTFLQLQPLIGNGLLISHGQEWVMHRRLLAPAFQSKLLRRFGSSVVRHADRLVTKLDKTSGTSIEVTDNLFSCLLDAIVDTSMGRQLDTQLVEHSPYIAAFHKTSELLFQRMINPLLASDFIFKRTALWRDLNTQLQMIHELMESVIEQRAAQLMEQRTNLEEGRGQCNLLDTLLLTRMGEKSLSLQQIRDQVNTFVFAGVDTTTAAMAFVLYALAKHPEAQAKLSAEIDQLAGEESADSDVDALNQLPYLDMFLKEVLRYYTIVPTTGRQTTRDTRIGGRIYCAGVTLWINMYGLAHDPQYFELPYEFRPERWANNNKTPPAYSYIPFSGGPHVCIGKKYSLLLLKALTVRIVRRFHLEPGNPGEHIVLQAQMVLRARDGIHIKFQRR